MEQAIAKAQAKGMGAVTYPRAERQIRTAKLLGRERPKKLWHNRCMAFGLGVVLHRGQAQGEGSPGAADGHRSGH